MTTTIKTAYKKLVSEGTILPDAGQLEALEALCHLEDSLNTLQEPSRYFSAFFARPKHRGLYLYGPVGRGKSMLMDLFFASAPILKKRRLHFNAFMAEIHADREKWARMDIEARKSYFGVRKDLDLMTSLAVKQAGLARLLCLDEIQIMDIADGMIVGRLFEALLLQGVLIVATSNQSPDNLYQDGINRQSFLPFIKLIKENMQVIAVSGPSDHRLDHKGTDTEKTFYFSPVTFKTQSDFDNLWKKLLKNTPEEPFHLKILGRDIIFPRSGNGYLRSQFDQLCQEALGPRDYLAISEYFHTVFLENMPQLTPDLQNAIARFITLIDTLYDNHLRLVILAEVGLEDLYKPNQAHAENPAQAFAFLRTHSRLEDMRSQAYWIKTGLQGEKD